MRHWFFSAQVKNTERKMYRFQCEWFFVFSLCHCVIHDRKYTTRGNLYFVVPLQKTWNKTSPLLVICYQPYVVPNYETKRYYDKIKYKVLQGQTMFFVVFSKVGCCIRVYLIVWRRTRNAFRSAEKRKKMRQCHYFLAVQAKSWERCAPNFLSLCPFSFFTLAAFTFSSLLYIFSTMGRYARSVFYHLRIMDFCVILG